MQQHTRRLIEARKDFPILSQRVNDRPLVYFDNGATTQKPNCVIEAVDTMCREYNANIHRGVHTLSQRSTEAYEEARKIVAGYLHASPTESCIFTSGTTGSINLLAYTMSESILKSGDTILISEMEHHSNLVPWQIVAKRRGIHLKKIPILDDGRLDMQSLESSLKSGVKLVCVTHISNTMGVINPIEEIADLTHRHGALLLVDGAQGSKHAPIEVERLGADFYAMSGHKIYGPTGIGVLWGRKSLLEQLPPWQGGGDMVDQVSFEETTFADLPFKFEAGTPPYIQAVGLGAAMEYYQQFDAKEVIAHENHLMNLAHEKIANIPGILFYGYHKDNAGILSFNVEGIHHYDLGMLLDKQGVAVRTGTHCTQPLMIRFGITGTVRASFALYNTEEEVEIFAQATHKAVKMLR